MTVTEFYDAVSRDVDTDKIKVTAADTKRVLAVAFSHLQKLDPADMADVLAKGLALAKRKAATTATSVAKK